MLQLPAFVTKCSIYEFYCVLEFSCFVPLTRNKRYPTMMQASHKHRVVTTATKATSK